MSHPAERVRRRRPSRRRHPMRWAAGGMTLLMLMALGAWSVQRYSSATVSSSVALRQDLVTRARQASPPIAFSRQQRAVYPYSVVPGGVRTARELLEASQHDGVVAAHYASFDFRKARLIQVKQARKVYVSYRIGDKVFWTRKQLSLHIGENLITDGRIIARSRCGNQVSEIRHIATSPAEPSVETLDQLIPEPAAPPVPFESALLQPPGFAVTALPPLGELPPGLTVPPPIGGGGCTPTKRHPCYPSTPPGTPPVSMDEPDEPSLLGSLALFWLGVAGIYVHRRRLRSKIL